MGQLAVHNILAGAFPALMFIYPITIVLILLNVIPEKFATPKVFKAVVIVTIIFSIPDFLATLGPKIANEVEPVQDLMPLGANRLGWLIPAIVTFVLINTLQQIGKKT
jgi:LIVCS family branched-chain amino acid:cation transporter